MADIEKFRAITENMAETYESKNADYGDSFSILWKWFGKLVGAVHVFEKALRIVTLTMKGTHKVNESLTDSYLDCANYCILTLMELGYEPGKSKRVLRTCEENEESAEGARIKQYTREPE